MKTKSLMLIIMLIAVAFLFTACDTPEFTSAKMYVQQKQMDKAEEFFLKAMKSEPTNPEIPFRLARDVYGPAKDYKNVNKYFNESLKRGKTFKANIEKLNEYYWSMAFNEGVKYYNFLVKNKYDDKETTIANSIEKFQTAQLFKPNNPKAYLQEATIVFSFQENHEKAIEILNNALEIIPNNIDLLTKKGLFLNNIGKTDESLAIFKNVIEKDPENLKIGQAYAEILFKQEKYEKSADVYKNLITIHPDKKNLYFNLALSYIRLGKLEEAKSQFENVLAFDPNDKETILVVGDTYLQLKDYITAEVYYRQLIEMEPTNPKYLKRLANALNGQQKYEEGMKYFRQAKALEK
ncbi:MAG: tetratricopeptide repeat protein [Candidatus Marinimicrobia bacterium]|nr:tetratricopeptide repeat protein [Candidatus Neomarinimicrobiota bacterium]